MQSHKNTLSISLASVKINATADVSVVKGKTLASGAKTEALKKKNTVCSRSNRIQAFDFVGIAG